ncbi:MAG: nitroreductase family protein [candidate division Zixibacteria bacterium]|nr:nitroreductase family protein [candidate division Zixibacteria bacterium]
MSGDDNMPTHHGDNTNTTGNFDNETIQLLHERSSCRSFVDRPIPDEVMRTILEAGTHAPTGGNLQPFSIIRIDDPATKKRLVELCGDQTFIAKAPTNLLFCIDWFRLRRWAEVELAPFAATSSFHHFWISFQDTVIAAQNICTAADAMGLGSVYVGTVTECFPQLREMFELPNGVLPVVLLSLGYPTKRPSPKRKLDIDIITHNEKYRRLSDNEITEAYDKKYPSRGVEVTDERLRDLERVCLKVHGEEFAHRCLERIREKGRISISQRYFGLHYVADEMAEGSDAYLQLMRDFGFDWFDKYEPHGNQ